MKPVELIGVAIVIMFGVITIVVAIIGGMAASYMKAQKAHRKKMEAKHQTLEQSLGILSQLLRKMNDDQALAKTNQDMLSRIVISHDEKLKLINTNKENGNG